VTYSEAKNKFEKLFNNTLLESEAKELLVSLYQNKETSDEIAAAATVMREHSIKLDIPKNIKNKLIDIVGTGGDKSGSFNISSTVSLILASLGSLVAKHGNRAITSNSGSADMLEKLGINLDLTSTQQLLMLQEVGFTFMFAINHHPAMKHIMPIRKSLQHRTIFNILGPLTNPASSKKYLLGVFSQDFLKCIADSLNLLNTTRAMVVNSRDGLDEISVSDITYVLELNDGKISESIIDPQNLGFKLSPLEEIKGGDALTNAKITLDIFDGREGAKRDIVLLNSGAALVIDGRARDLKDGIDMAREAIDSKLAKKHLQKIVEISNKL
jgi:anthranilate phosphoribosyltransferase